MNPLVFRTVARFITPVLLLYSVFMLLRGHNEPGGGFIGGLLAATPFVIYALAYDVDRARRLLRLSPGTLFGVGLLTAALSGCVGIFTGLPFMYGLWLDTPLPTGLKFGTVLVFDIGVYMVVMGAVLAFILTLLEDL